MADAPAGGGSKVMVYVRIALRAVALVCAIVVMGVSADQLKGTLRSVVDYCVLGLNRNDVFGDKDACDYGIGVGALTMLCVIAFIVLDILLFLRGVGGGDVIKIFSIVDLVLSGILALLWLVGFIYILDKWDDSAPKHEVLPVYDFELDDKASAVGAAIAFCLFGAIIWVVLAIMAGLRLRQAAASSS